MLFFLGEMQKPTNQKSTGLLNFKSSPYKSLAHIFIKTKMDKHMPCLNANAESKQCLVLGLVVNIIDYAS